MTRRIPTNPASGKLVLGQSYAQQQQQAPVFTIPGWIVQGWEKYAFCTPLDTIPAWAGLAYKPSLGGRKTLPRDPQLYRRRKLIMIWSLEGININFESGIFVQFLLLLELSLLFLSILLLPLTFAIILYLHTYIHASHLLKTLSWKSKHRGKWRRNWAEFLDETSIKFCKSKKQLHVFYWLMLRPVLRNNTSFILFRNMLRRQFIAKKIAILDTKPAKLFSLLPACNWRESSASGLRNPRPPGQVVAGR